MRFTTSLALVGALLATGSTSVCASETINPSEMGTYPAFLAYQQKVLDGTATSADKEQLAQLGQQLADNGTDMKKVTGTTSHGLAILDLISSGSASKAFSSTAGGAAVAEVLGSRGVKATHEAPRPVSDPVSQNNAAAGSVPNFIGTMNQVYSGDDSAATYAALITQGVALLDSGVSIDQLSKILGSDEQGTDALSAILDKVGASEDVEEVTAADDAEKRAVTVDVSKLLTAPSADSEVPSDNVSAFLFYASKFWSNPSSAGALDAAGLARFISIGQTLQQSNPNAVRTLLGTSDNGLALAKIVNAGTVTKRGFQQHRRDGVKAFENKL